MADRDPRVDPRPGDVLRTTRNVPFPEHEVLAATKRRVDFATIGLNGSVAIDMSGWRAWAKTATIIRKGDEA